ncbi:doublecortin domain-containing protein 1-like [Notamacropus eugenii]|uniref:doublecortin domain-containing protein 1-like n=1 Tax=Notamacropus eugenii TaxID=9315 RepID=UPI003B680920
MAADEHSWQTVRRHTRTCRQIPPCRRFCFNWRTFFRSSQKKKLKLLLGHRLEQVADVPRLWRKEIVDHLLLMKKVTWTVNGLMLPTDVKRRKTKSLLCDRMKKHAEKTSVSVWAFQNGGGQDGCEITMGQDALTQFLCLKNACKIPSYLCRDLFGWLRENVPAPQELRCTFKEFYWPCTND